jgi:multiple sugar transport system permease protein
MPDRGMTKFVGLGSFAFLVSRDRFWMVVLFKAIIGFVVAHFMHNIPTKGQRKCAACCWCRGSFRRP